MSNMKTALYNLFTILSVTLSLSLHAFDCTINYGKPKPIIEVCEGGFAAVKADSLILAENEVVGYILLDNAAGVPINYLAYNHTGIFSRGTANYDELYYIFTVVGFDYDGDELPDLNVQSTQLCGYVEVVFLPENFFGSENYYCNDTLITALVNDCGNSAGIMPDAIYNVCFGLFGVSTAVNVIVETGFHLRYLLHDSASTDSLGNIIAINETGIFYNNGILPNNQDFFVSAYVGPLDANNMPILNDGCASIALPGTPLRFYEVIELTIVNQQTDLQTGATEITFYLTGGAPSFPFYNPFPFYTPSPFYEYFVEGDYSGVVEDPYEEITFVVYENEYEIIVASDGKDCGQSFLMPILTDTLLNVYPGDVNRNGIVNNEDVALMGLYMYETGPARSAEHQNMSWYPHPAEDWNRQHTNQIDLKHFDCNGDGIINSLDIEAIVMNYRNVHDEALSQGETTLLDSTNYQIILLPLGEINNNSLTIDVVLKNAENSNLSLQGAFFTIDYNYLLSGLNIAEFNFLPSSWLGETDDNLYTLTRHVDGANSIEVGFTKTDGNNSMGNGTIGQLIFTFNDPHACCSSNIYDIPTIQIHTAQANNVDAINIPLQSQLLQINPNDPNDPDFCELSWLITKDVPFQNIYQSTGTISTEGEVYIGTQQQVSYKAMRVRLNNGFKIKEGALFNAGNANCPTDSIIDIIPIEE